MILNEISAKYLPRAWDLKTILITAIVLVLPFIVTYIFTASASSIGTSCKERGAEPPPVPYWTPFLGNIFYFAFNTLSCMRYIRKTFGNIPVRIRLGPEKIYFVSGSHNVLRLFNNSRDLSTKALNLLAIVTAFGMPARDAKMLEADDSGILVQPHPNSVVRPERRLFYLTHHRLGSHLSGSGLSELSRQFIANFSKQIANNKKILHDKWTELPDLFDFVRSEAFLATTTALCGPHIFELNPRFAEDFWEFDSWLPMIMKRVPRWIIPRGYASRDKNHSNIMKWHKYADENFDWADQSMRDVWWEPYFGAKVMRGAKEMYKATNDVSLAGQAANDLGMIWAANANVVPAIGWSMIHILSDESLTARIRAEIAPAFSSSAPESVDITKLSACPTLQSVIAEVLRLHVALLINRISIIPDFKMGNWTFQPGKIILASIYLSHRNEEKWNTGRVDDNGKQEHPVDEFWAERFLKYPNDPLSGPLRSPTRRTSSEKLDAADRIEHDDKDAKFTVEGLDGVYVPFGGGLKICPGRHYAKQEMYLAVAMLLWAFDFELVDLKGVKDTKADMRAFAVGTLTPDRKNPVRLKRRPT